MPRYAYIDESGTLQDQRVMTVALVLLEGQRSSEKLHLKISKEVFQPPKVRGLAEKERWYGKQKLHFVEMDTRQRQAMGAELAKANICAVIANYWHTDASSTHEHRFAMYRQLLQGTISRAFELADDLIVFIAKQGGWEAYSQDLLQDLRLIPDKLTQGGDYRKGQFILTSPQKPGAQIADYFASSSRNFLLAGSDKSQACPYELVQHHVKHFEEHKVADSHALLKEK